MHDDYFEHYHTVFSAGVSEHVYDRDRTSYGDVGPLLGRNVRNCLQKQAVRKK
ncbi:MAG: hypothetical protein U1D67_07975 [Dehalococcoidia bacterium]|nr:hypothetical protein [Dehalococcoidia bacterium]